MFVALESAVFMGKNYVDKFHSITKETDLTFTPMFISARLVFIQDDISGVETNCGEKIG